MTIFNLNKTLLRAGGFALFLLGGSFSACIASPVTASYLYNLSNFEGPVIFGSATGLVSDERHDELFVADRENSVIRIFDTTGMEIAILGEDGSLGDIRDMALGENGTIYLLSSIGGKHGVLVLNFQGEISAIVRLKNLPSEFATVSLDRVFQQGGKLYFLDTRTSRIVCTNTQGSFLKGYDIPALMKMREKDRKDAAIGGFYEDEKGNLYFTLPTFFSAYCLSPDGKLASFGTKGSAPGRFANATGIVADERGYVYVSDQLRHTILVFDNNFRFQTEISSFGRGPGSLLSPREISMDRQGRLYVAQARQHAVSVFKVTHGQ